VASEGQGDVFNLVVKRREIGLVSPLGLGSIPQGSSSLWDAQRKLAERGGPLEKTKG